jgi:hypothetical protein
MLHFSLWTDLAVLFAVVILVVVLVVLNSNMHRRPRPTRRKVPERIDIRLAEILEQRSVSLAEMPVQDALRQEAEREAPGEGQGARPEAESLPELDHELVEEDSPQEEGRPWEEDTRRGEEAMVSPREVGAGSARLFRREEEEAEEIEPDGESNELRQRLEDRYAMYLRERDAS